MSLTKNFERNSTMLAPITLGAVCDIWQICRSLLYSSFRYVNNTSISMEYEAKSLIWCHVTHVQRVPFTKSCLLPWKSYLNLLKHDLLLSIMFCLIMLWMVQKCWWNSAIFFGCGVDAMTTILWRHRKYFSVMDGVDRMLFFLSSAVGTFCQVTLSVTWQEVLTALSFHKKYFWYSASPISLDPWWYHEIWYDIKSETMFSTIGSDQLTVKSASASSNMCKSSSPSSVCSGYGLQQSLPPSQAQKTVHVSRFHRQLQLTALHGTPEWQEHRM